MSDQIHSDNVNGLFTLDELKSKPINCDTDHHEVRISVPSIIGSGCDSSGCDDENGGREPCAAREDGQLDITVDGVSIVHIQSTHRYACGLEGRFRIEVTRFGYTDCKMQGEGLVVENAKAVDMMCSRKLFKTPL